VTVARCTAVTVPAGAALVLEAARVTTVKTMSQLADGLEVTVPPPTGPAAPGVVRCALPPVSSPADADGVDP
jgi:hypothetical protein